MNLRCQDYILQRGCQKVGIPYLPDRLAQLTVAHNGHAACHFCGNCTEGCDTGSFFSTPYFLLPPAEKTGKLELRVNAVVRSVLVDADGKPNGVAYVDRATRQEVEVRGRLIVVAALRSSRHGSCSTRSHASGHRVSELQWTARTQSLLLVRHDRQRVSAAARRTAAVPRQRLREPDRLDAAVAEPHQSTPGAVHSRLLDLSDRGMRRISLYQQGRRRVRQLAETRSRTLLPGTTVVLFPDPIAPSSTNYVDIDPEVKDAFGISALRVHFQWGQNELLMWEHAKQATVDAITASGGQMPETGTDPNTPGWSLHETGTCRMGNDPAHFVTNRFGQLHDAANVVVADASVFLTCSDKTTTLSILAFSLRASEHAVEAMKGGQVRGSLATARLLSPASRLGSGLALLATAINLTRLISSIAFGVAVDDHGADRRDPRVFRRVAGCYSGGGCRAVVSRLACHIRNPRPSPVRVTGARSCSLPSVSPLSPPFWAMPGSHGAMRSRCARRR